MNIVQRFSGWFSRQSTLVKVLTIIGALTGSGLTFCCCGILMLVAVVPPSARTPVAGQISTASTDVPLVLVATTEVDVTAEPAATATPEPTAPSATPTIVADHLSGNAVLTTEPSVFGEQIGSACEGDAVTVLAQHEGSVLHYYRIRVEALGGEDCINRVAVGTEGWIIDNSLKPTVIAVASIPTTTPPPATSTPVGPSPELQAYLREVTTNVESIGKALQEMSTLSQNPRLTDNDWILSMAIQTVSIEQADENLRKIANVPPEAADLHVSLLDATGTCAGAMDILRTGIDARNAAQINQASQMIRECGTKVTTTQQQYIQPLMDKYG
ncbi:MAG TPA: hypothetical protein VFS21_17400 [Roseiflexaceae bacterium]|nr:hypothetical protein [Roseiflexaceae bacterium]